MKIAQVAPLYESVPPKLYGGTERVVYYLTEELIKLGHEVSLFASGDSKTNATLVADISEALRLKKEGCEDMIAPHIVQLQSVLERANDFDIIHFHNDYLHFPVTDNSKIPHITTLHGKLTIPELQSVYNTFPNQPVVSISDSQRQPMPQANFVATVYHGLPENLFSVGDGREGYLAFLGRISPEKGCDRAIEIAIATNTPIKIAAKIDKADLHYFEKKIKDLFDHPLVTYVGEINDKQKNDFLGNAKALLFPIDWNEPFGIVVIEAMACGTPVIAWNMGSVPEIIENGKSGFVVSSVEESINALDKLSSVQREDVRKAFEQRFTAKRMADDYLKVYEDVIAMQSVEQIINTKNISLKGSLANNKIEITNQKSVYDTAGIYTG
jgi:glycosyltransferase involved in cell wall biosynthesis